MGSFCSKEEGTTAASAANGGGTGTATATAAATTDPASSAGFRETKIFLTKVADTARGAAKTATKGAAHHVRNVFATPFEFMDLNNYKTPVNPKSVEEEMLLKRALKRNFVFEHLTDKEIQPLVLAFEKEEVEAGTVIIKQHDMGDYFYVIQSGECQFDVDGKSVGTAAPGASFGELALLYNCPRAATVTALTKASLFRVDQTAFRYILNAQARQHEDDKLKLLRGVPFLKGLEPSELSKLASVMTPKLFTKGEYLFRKGDVADNFYIIEEGTLKACNLSAGESKYEDIEIGPGGFGGERAIMTGEPRAGDLIAQTDGQAFCIDKETFSNVLGDLEDLVTKSVDKTVLQGIKVFSEPEFEQKVYTSLAALIVNRTFKKGATIVKAGEKTEAALYLIRSGKVQEKAADGTLVVRERGGYFGHESMLTDSKTGKNKAIDTPLVTPEYTLTVLEDCVCGVLTLVSCRKVINTLYLGKSKAEIAATVATKEIRFSDLKRHTILGAGTFGQVWLVSSEGPDGKRTPYALKVQSKYELMQDGQAKAVANEKNIMAMMNSPFLISLVNTYQDDKFVYMLLGLVQGGELYNVIHGGTRKGLPENKAQFYAAGIAEGLGYMHRRGYVYRDLKPENVLIGSDGYTVIVDFGFAKYVSDKTYTLCGTPLYLPPEVIMNRGHNGAADHWSLGVLIYELIAGKTPFYQEGMDQLELFKANVRGRFTLPRGVSAEGASIIKGLITKDPSQRLGSLKGGEDDILNHPWFSSIDVEKLRMKQIPAPFVPKIKNPLDASNFDDWSHLEDKTKKKYPKLTPEQDRIFATF